MGSVSVSPMCSIHTARFDACCRSLDQVCGSLQLEIGSVEELHKRCSSYWIYGAALPFAGLRGALAISPSATDQFFTQTLPAMMKAALALPTLVPAQGIRILNQGEVASVLLVRAAPLPMATTGIVCSALELLNCLIHAQLEMS